MTRNNMPGSNVTTLRARRFRTALVGCVACAACAGLALACSKMDAAPSADMPPPAPPPPPPGAMAEAGDAKMDEPAPAKTQSALKKAKQNAMERAKDRSEAKGMARAAAAPAQNAPEAQAGGEAPAETPAPTRAWFPETFLFAPRVITADDGTANVDVLIPDRLTTWRVLALAHSRKGAQAGALTTMQSQLPVSVDLVVPPFLIAGDRVALPIQIANSTDKALVRAIHTKAEGQGSLNGAPGNVHVDAESTSTQTAWLDATEPGEIAVQADVGGDDSVRRTITVKSAGRPRHEEQSGTLAAKRTFTMTLDSGVLDHSARASLQVFPGALAILKSELAAAPDRSDIDDDAYLLSLAGRARTLSTKLGAPVDDKTLTHLARLAGQRLARRAVNPDPFAAMALAPGALASDPESLIGKNGEHLAELVARSQRPDGTFGGGNGWPLSRLLTATAAGVTAVRAASATPEQQRRAAATTLRARGAFERFAPQIDDAYTAAVVVASGAVEGDVRAELKKKIIAAVAQESDGRRTLTTSSNSLRVDGSRPSTVEATAMAILALHDEPLATPLLPDLGATVLSAYRAGAGFGDGATNRAALDAVALLFAEPMPSKVAVTLTVNGKAVGTDTLSGDRLHEVMTLDGAIAATHGKSSDTIDVVVEADPPLPGLSYVLAIDYAVPWPKAPADAGLTLDVAVKGPLSVGKAADIELRAVAPGGSPLHVVQGLPAGVDAVRASLEALVSSRAITKFEINDGVVTLDAPARNQGELFDVHYKVMPTLAGSLHARVASVALASSPSSQVFFPPSTWTIAK